MIKTILHLTVLLLLMSCDEKVQKSVSKSQKAELPQVQDTSKLRSESKTPKSNLDLFREGYYFPTDSVKFDKYSLEYLALFSENAIRILVYEDGKEDLVFYETRSYYKTQDTLKLLFEMNDDNSLIVEGVFNPHASDSQFEDTVFIAELKYKSFIDTVYFKWSQGD